MRIENLNNCPHAWMFPIHFNIENRALESSEMDLQAENVLFEFDEELQDTEPWIIEKIIHDLKISQEFHVRHLNILLHICDEDTEKIVTGIEMIRNLTKTERENAADFAAYHDECKQAANSAYSGKFSL